MISPISPGSPYPEAVTAQGDGGAAPAAQDAEEGRVHPGHARRVRHHGGRDLEHVHCSLTNLNCVL